MEESDSIIVNVSVVSTPTTVSLTYQSSPILVEVNLTQTPVTVSIMAAKDAYQLALDDGFVGTRSEWLASLVGTPGAPGTPGTDGDPGPPGTGLAWVQLTAAQYDALPVIDPNTIYDITDAIWEP